MRGHACRKSASLVRVRDHIPQQRPSRSETAFRSPVCSIILVSITFQSTFSLYHAMYTTPPANTMPVSPSAFLIRTSSRSTHGLRHRTRWSARRPGCRFRPQIQVLGNLWTGQRVKTGALRRLLLPALLVVKYPVGCSGGVAEVGEKS